MTTRRRFYGTKQHSKAERANCPDGATVTSRFYARYSLGDQLVSMPTQGRGGNYCPCNKTRSGFIVLLWLFAPFAVSRGSPLYLPRHICTISRSIPHATADIAPRRVALLADGACQVRSSSRGRCRRPRRAISRLCRTCTIAYIVARGEKAGGAMLQRETERREVSCIAARGKTRGSMSQPGQEDERGKVGGGAHVWWAVIIAAVLSEMRT
jgi:hypothetical protein